MISKKDYYRNYLKSLEARLAADSSELEPASAQTANPVPVGGIARIGAQAETSTSPGGRSGSGRAPSPYRPCSNTKAAPIPAWAALNLAQQDYPCARIEAAKTEAFLGINSASTMSAAIKDSESDEPSRRILAAAIFCTSEARKQSRIEDAGRRRGFEGGGGCQIDGYLRRKSPSGPPHSTGFKLPTQIERTTAVQALKPRCIFCLSPAIPFIQEERVEACECARESHRQEVKTAACRIAAEQAFRPLFKSGGSTVIATT